MVRQMTFDEKSRFRANFSNLNVDRAVVTGEATQQYNCISWTLGITDRWIWPGPHISDFDNLYQRVGYKRVGNGPVAAWGHSESRMTHGSVSGPTHGPRWESKCGTDLRIQHDLNELVSPSYGRVVAFYSLSQTLHRTAAGLSETGEARMSYSSEIDAHQIEELVSTVPRDLSDKFDTLFAEWMEAIGNSQTVRFSSDPAIVRTLPEFDRLTELGPDILPLIVKKLLDPSNFFAIQVYEALQKNSDLLVNFKGEDDRVLEGEQARALRIAAHWFSNQ